MQVGKHKQRVTLWRAPQHSDDADGYFEALTPSAWWILLQPFPPQDNDRTNTSLVTMRYHRQVTVDTRIVLGDDPQAAGVRQLIVVGVQDLDNEQTEMRLLCQDVTP